MRVIVFILNQLSSLVDMLSRPGRWFQGKIVRGVGSADVTAGAERWTNRFLHSLATPFLVVSDAWERANRGKDRVYDQKSEKERIENRVRQVERKTSSYQFWSLLLIPIVVPVSFLWLILSSRRKGLIWWSLPLICVAFVLGYAVYRQSFQSNTQLSRRYQEAMSAALKNNDESAVNIYRAKLEQLGGRSSSAKYQNALALEKNGKLDEAEKAMREMAPVSGFGMAGAHYWVASRLLQGQIGQSNEQEFKEAKTHLQKLLSLAGDDESLHLLSGIAALKLGEQDEAVQHLEEAASQKLLAAGILFDLAVRNQDLDRAKQFATKVRVLINERESVAGGQLSEQEHRWKVATTGILGNEVGAEAAVARWHQQHPESDQARLQKAQSLLRKFDRVLEDKNVPVDTLTEHLAHAAAIMPLQYFQFVATRYETAWKQKHTSARAKLLLDQLATRDDLAGPLCEEIGTRLVLDGKMNDALMWLEAAVNREPNWHRGQNNFAFVLSETSVDRMQEALSYANLAVEMEPANPDYRETRGTILFQLKDWEACVGDLEVALNGAKDLSELHRKLAIAYDALGDARIAKLHAAESAANK